MSVDILLPPNSPIILVFRHRIWFLKSSGFTPNGGTEYRGWENCYKLVYLRNGGRYSHSWYRSRLGNHTQPIKWWHFRWPWVTEPPVSRSSYSSKANISQTVHATAGNMTSFRFLS